MVLTATAADAAERRRIDFEYVVEQARQLAEREYEAPDTSLPGALADLNYDQYRDIRFKPSEALWRRDGLPWALELFHRAYLFPEPVKIFEFNDTHVQEVRFVPDWYDYGPRSGLEPDAWFPSDLDYAGIRIKYPINDPKVYDEVAVFLGASYFRMLGQDQIYGISARGLAINTLREEEFPRFTRFWLRRPTLESESILIYALLDGESVTGAYSFRIIPGEVLRTEVKTTIFLRREVERLGFAPFSSMYYFGENTVQPPPDYRPEVHDSDGLLIGHGDGTYAWRPLTNEHRTKDTAVSVQSHFQGFGLMQRDRDFDRYQDLESKFEDRPSVWVEPVGSWPAGRVALIELLSRNEIMDNIVAFWEPEEMPAVGEPYTREYVLHWEREHPVPVSKVLATWAGKSVNVAEEGTVVVDFAEIPEDRLAPEAEPSPQISVAEGAELVHSGLVRNPHTGGWRLSLQIRPSPDDEMAQPGVEMEARLESNSQPLTETWKYLWIPPE